MKREIRGTIDISVEFRDVDLLNVVHNSVYFLWFERGRLSLLETIVPFSEALKKGIAMIVVHQSCDYLAPARFGDELILTTRTVLSDSYEGRLRFRHELANKRTLASVAGGETELTLWNVDEKRLIRTVPESIRDRIVYLIQGGPV